jgi:ribosomal protein L7/L12
MTFLQLILLFIIVVAIISVFTLIFNRKPIQNISDDNDVKSILESGDKIKAIKAYRQLHGVGLKEAKQSIERLSSQKDN